MTRYTVIDHHDEGDVETVVKVMPTGFELYGVNVTRGVYAEASVPANVVAIVDLSSDADRERMAEAVAVYAEARGLFEVVD